MCYATDMHNMIRTTLFLPPALHQRLLISSKQRKKSFSAFARDLFASYLADEEQKDIEQVYRAMDRMKGVGNPRVTDGSTTINKTLYGEHGAWRASDR